jgi:hypothetical protein
MHKYACVFLSIMHYTPGYTVQYAEIRCVFVRKWIPCMSVAALQKKLVKSYCQRREKKSQSLAGCTDPNILLACYACFCFGLQHIMTEREMNFTFWWVHKSRTVQASKNWTWILSVTLACRADRAERPAALIAGLTTGYVRTQLCL